MFLTYIHKQKIKWSIQTNLSWHDVGENAVIMQNDTCLKKVKLACVLARALWIWCISWRTAINHLAVYSTLGIDNLYDFNLHMFLTVSSWCQGMKRTVYYMQPCLNSCEPFLGQSSIQIQSSYRENKLTGCTFLSPLFCQPTARSQKPSQIQCWLILSAWWIQI